MPMGEDPRHGLLVALVMALVGLLVLIFAALTVAPVLVIVLGLMTYVVWWYVSREDTSYMHHAQEHENRFWTTVAFCFSGALVFVHDSPMALGQWSPVLGFLFVMMFTFSVHSYDRQLHRSRIGRAPNFRPSVESSTMLHSSVQDKCRRISVCLSKLDNRLVATNLNHMLWADMVQDLEKEIVNILSDADPTELNYMLPKIGLGLLFYKVKDHAPMNLHRTRLLNLLGNNRISDLSVTSRALVLDALQQLKLSAHKDSEAYAKKLILKTKGDELSELKNLTDAKGDIHSFHKLVYRDIKDVAVREEVLKHIANQARVQAAHMRLGTRTGSRRSGKAWRKILSDVDDTLTSSGGRFPAGVDKRYPRKSVYPGVLDFYRELDLGVNGPSEWPKGQLGNLVFLSARPHVYKDMSESKSYAKFKTLQEEKGLYTSPSLLAGSIDTGTTMLLTGNMGPIAEKKFQNFAEYVSLYPEFKHVFVGDNGQGDVRAAEMMVENFPGRLEAVYMHRVVPEEKTFGFQGAATRQKWKEANIVFVGDYVEAACHAYKNGLIQAVGLQRVCQAAVEQFVDMKFESPQERELQRRQINQSVWQANKLLQAANLEPNWLIRAERVFDDLEAVLTPFGRGTVVNFRPEDGVYEVLLDWSHKVSTPTASRTTVKVATPPATPHPLTSQSAHGLGQHRSPIAAPSRPGMGSRPASFPITPRAPTGSRSPTLPAVPPASASAAADAAAAADAVPAVAAPPPPSALINGAVAAGRGRGTINPELPLLPAQQPLITMPQRGPDAAGGGEAIRDSRASNITRQAVPETAATGTVAAAVAQEDGNGGAEEAAGAPAVAPASAAGPAAFPSLFDHPTDDGLEGNAAFGGNAALAAELPHGHTGAPAAPTAPAPASASAMVLENPEPAAARTEAAAEALQGSSQPRVSVAAGAGESGVDGESTVSPAGLIRPGSAEALLLDELVGGSVDPGSDEASWKPASLEENGVAEDRPEAAEKRQNQQDESVAATAASLLTAKMPGSMAVRAYLQLSSLKKAPLEVKKIQPKEETDEPKSGRLSTRLSIFSRQQDSGTAAGGRPTAKGAIVKGAVVQTLFGPAVVRRVRTEDGVCEVSFQKWVLAGGKPALGVFREADLVVDASAPVGKSPSLFGRTGKAISSLFKLSAEQPPPSASVATPPAPPEPRVGDIVDTIFGPAAVTAVRGGPASTAAADSPEAEKAAAAAAAAATAAGKAAMVHSSRMSTSSAPLGERRGGGARPRDVDASAGVASAPLGFRPPGSGSGGTDDPTSEGSRVSAAVAPSSSSRAEATPPRPVRHQSTPQQQQQLMTPPRPTFSSSISTPPGAPQTSSSLPPLSPVPLLSLRPSRRPRGATISVPGRDNQHSNHHHRHASYSGGIGIDIGGVGISGMGRGRMVMQFSGSAAGDLVPGQLLSSPSSSRADGLNQRGGGGGGSGSGNGARRQSNRRSSAPPSPATTAAKEEGFDDTPHGEDSDGDSEDDDQATSLLGIRILERRGDLVGGRSAPAASPTDAVMYEVAFMKWRLNKNTPARAVLNRSSIWAEWETRPLSSARGGPSSGRRRSSRRHSGGTKRSSRPSSFFGFMSMVGGYAGGGGTTKLLESPLGSPRRSPATKNPAKPATRPLHSCDFPPGACVKTGAFGPALVTKFRPEDGIYQVSLLSWRLGLSGGLATAYVARSAIVSSIAVPGAAVRTAMGPATVELVREDGVVVVVAGRSDVARGTGAGAGGVRPAPAVGDRVRPTQGGQRGVTMFLQISSILGPAKASLGDRVDTNFGWGVLCSYRAASDTYVVDLGWGLLNSPNGNAIKERRPLAESAPLSARSSGGIIKLFRWPLFGTGSSASAAPSPPQAI